MSSPCGYAEGCGIGPNPADVPGLSVDEFTNGKFVHSRAFEAPLQCAATVAGRGGHWHERDMLIVIDEMPRLGYLKPVMDGYTMAAGKGVHFWCFAQSISALDSTWGKEHRKTLLDLAEVVQVLGFPRTDAEGAEAMSKAIGTATFEGRTESRSGTVADSRVAGNIQWQAGESFNLVRERLVTPDELMTLGPDRQYVIGAAKDIERDALHLHHAHYWERPDTSYLVDPNPLVLRKRRAAANAGSGGRPMAAAGGMQCRRRKGQGCRSASTWKKIVRRRGPSTGSGMSRGRDPAAAMP